MQHTNIDKEFVIVSDGNEDQAGATVWWRLHGEADRQALVLALENEALDQVTDPKPVEPETALRRAVDGLRGKRRLVRPLRRGAWAIIEEELDVSNDKLKHWNGPTVTLDKIGRAILKNASVDEAQQVQTSYAHFLDVLTTHDVSHWLLTQIERLGAIGLREGGGIYYVPPQRMPEWRAIVGALQEAAPSHHVYMVPTVRMTADGARAILDSLTSEIESEVTRVFNEVVSGELGVRALDKRADDSKALLAKVAQYESVIGERLENLRAQVGALEVDVAAARLAAEAAREDGAA